MIVVAPHDHQAEAQPPQSQDAIGNQVKRVLTVEETARDYLHISQWLAYEEIKRTGQLAGIKPIRIGRRLLFSRAALERVLAGE